MTTWKHIEIWYKDEDDEEASDFFRLLSDVIAVSTIEMLSEERGISPHIDGCQQNDPPWWTEGTTDG